jgi:DnaK suppressor protein
MKNVDVRVDYREQLVAARSDLLASLGLKAETIASMGRVGEEDLAQASHEEFVSLRLNGLDYEKLRMVEEALDRLDSGEYGICLACDEAIAPRRLQVVPWARYCVRCQDRASIEMGEYTPRLMETPNYDANHV